MRWFAWLKPKHTVASVARQLVEGLENGTLYLRESDREAALKLREEFEADLIRRPKNRYPVVVNRVIDGDTIVATIRTDFKLALEDEHCRLARIDCRELTEPGGPAAKTFVQVALLGNSNVTVEVRGKDKYGRRLVDVFYVGDDGIEKCLNDELSKGGHCKPPAKALCQEDQEGDVCS